MKKTKDISKFDLGWQVFRVSLKKLPTLMDKVLSAQGYLLSHRNRADKERVLNYLEGLSMAYRSEDRAYVLATKEILEELKVSDENPKEWNFQDYSDIELQALVKDLRSRTYKWLKKGYVHREQVEFLQAICEHLQDTDTISELHKRLEIAGSIKNTHSFFF